MKGGYAPSSVRARTCVPLRIAFDRQEDGDCSARVIFPDLAVSHWLLIALGTGAAFGCSTLVTFAPSLVPAEVREVYFEAVGVS